MIAFGCATTDDDEFRRGASQTIERFAERDSLLLRRHGRDSAARAFNEMLEDAARYDDLEALVLLAQDVWIEDGDFLTRVRGLLASGEDVAAIGAGATYGIGEAEAIEGGLATLSPWAVGQLRFDEAVTGPIECCLPDLCHQARARDRRVLVDDTRVARRSRGPALGEHGRAVEGAAAVSRKWADDLVPRRA